MDEMLDETDRRILRTLQKDASQSMDALAEQVHLSRNACWRRVKRLEADGIIAARVALVDAQKLGLSLTAFVMIRAGAHEAGWLKEFHKITRAMPEIQGAYRMSGDLDYLLRVRVGSMADYDRFYQRLVSKIALGTVSASFVMEPIKDSTALPI